MSDCDPISVEHQSAAAWTDEPIGDAARRALKKCLKKSAKRLAHCARRHDLDAEDIHQLRVAIRRADAALITFRPLLPPGRRRRLRKRLKKLRRRAGEIRDVDVLLQRLARPATSHTENVPSPCRHLHERRRALARTLQAAARREIDDRFTRRAARIVTRTRWREGSVEPPLSAAARSLLRPLVDRLRQAGAHDLSNLRRLHRFRVSVKRLRYAIDFVEAGLDRECSAQVRTQLSELQSQLGRVCDHAAALPLLDAERAALPADRSDEALDAVIRQERQRLADRQATFVGSWAAGEDDALWRALEACLGCP